MKTSPGHFAGDTPSGVLAGDYDVILCDPPWQYDFSVSDSRAIESKYPTMALDDLVEMREFVDALHGERAIMFMWATAPKLEDAMYLMRAWGFKYKTFDVWIKVRRDRQRDQLVLAEEMRPDEAEFYGMGYYTRIRHEPILIGTCGGFSPPEPARRPLSAFYAEARRHSQKPEIEHERIEFMYPDKKRIELFARERRAGWDVWGNEV